MSSMQARVLAHQSGSCALMPMRCSPFGISPSPTRCSLLLPCTAPSTTQAAQSMRGAQDGFRHGSGAVQARSCTRPASLKGKASRHSKCIRNAPHNRLHSPRVDCLSGMCRPSAQHQQSVFAPASSSQPWKKTNHMRTKSHEVG
ncbi:uncharacterized protein CC84DRAFT_185826 [Paraphaeosphaeria sporulosa]|uniref:Uncharacterized protein n=1 Tax=Paraphaeosphaeria sporulosa TaxID=1460663 RepID=A0A177C336_9PLEO|nr:uncharacterized protein CC84DRAFT_185826 [Paraphaeosphaeria sporulosa]OAG01302.1 hypothetical protein CC84DRAFT_185826 [Paraphaeosphaeria sporulosa]